MGSFFAPFLGLLGCSQSVSSGKWVRLVRLVFFVLRLAIFRAGRGGISCIVPRGMPVDWGLHLQALQFPGCFVGRFFVNAHGGFATTRNEKVTVERAA